jgi:hypothetical protein
MVDVRDDSMAMIVGVHGIGQQHKGAKTLGEEWRPALLDGFAAAGGEIGQEDFVCAFYGGLFRPSGTVRGEPAYRPRDVSGGLEVELLHRWWQEAATLEPARVVSADADVRAATPRAVQAGLRALSRSRFFAGIAQRSLIGSLKQVGSYLNDEAVRARAQESVDSVISRETRVVVAHSLGSVVVYEALGRFRDAPNWINVSTLVTLGSPLGIRNLIFDKLRPPPMGDQGAWPGRVRRWVNVSDDGDVVALEKRLGSFFAGDVVDIGVDNGATAHDVKPYLTAPETGEAIVGGLR